MNGKSPSIKPSPSRRSTSWWVSWWDLIYVLDHMEKLPDGSRIYHLHYALGLALAEEILVRGEAGFDWASQIPKSAKFFLIGLADGLNVPRNTLYHKGESAGSTFHLSTASRVVANLRTLVALLPPLLRGLRALIADEAVVTGTNAKIALNLVRAGLTSICMVFPSPPIRSCCPSMGEKDLLYLKAQVSNTAEYELYLERDWDVEWVQFLSLERTLQELNGFGLDGMVCLAAIDPSEQCCCREVN